MSAVEIVMPRLSDAMEEGTIVRWLKDVGDQVEIGDELVEVETDKATVIYEAEVSGLLSAILVQAGEAQQLGGPIARIGGEAGVRQAHGRPLATPVARRRATELGVELAAPARHRPARAHPPGRRRGRRRPRRRPRRRRPPPRPSPGRRSAAAAVQAGGRGVAERLPLTSTQRVIAQRMAETIATVPHFRLSVDVDFGEMLRLRKRLRAAVGEGAPTVNDIVVALTARALREHPARQQQLRGRCRRALRAHQRRPRGGPPGRAARAGRARRRPPLAR